jgi:hypothetical protein
MAFTEITSTTISAYFTTKNSGKDALDGIALDETNGNTIPYNSNMTLVISNGDTTDSNTVTLTSQSDSNGRSQTKTYTIAAGKFAIIPPLDSLFARDGKIELTIAGLGDSLKLIPTIFLP